MTDARKIMRSWVRGDIPVLTFSYDVSEDDLARAVDSCKKAFGGKTILVLPEGCSIELLQLSGDFVTMPKSRRLRIVHIAPEFVAAISGNLIGFTPEGKIVRTIENDVPAFARLCGVHYDVEKAAFAILLEHESFSEVPESERVPTLRGPVFKIEEGKPPVYDADDADTRLAGIAEILERIDHRCLAADGPVTDTRQEMRDDELRRIYELTQSYRSHGAGP